MICPPPLNIQKIKIKALEFGAPLSLCPGLWGCKDAASHFCCHGFTRIDSSTPGTQKPLELWRGGQSASQAASVTSTVWRRHVCNPSTREVEARGSEGPSHPWLTSEIEATWIMRPFKKKRHISRSQDACCM